MDKNRKLKTRNKTSELRQTEKMNEENRPDQKIGLSEDVRVIFSEEHNPDDG